MSAEASDSALGRIVAPRRHGELLVEPPIGAVGDVVRENFLARRDWKFDLLGQPLERLVAAARRDLIDAALQYTQPYRQKNLPPIESSKVFLAGHQPELFHAGVWAKNFMLGRLAREHRAVPINLLMESDLCRDVRVRVPSGSVAEPRVELVAMDASAPSVAWEERKVVDRSRFDDFGRRVTETIAPLVADPLVEEFWPLAIEAAQRTGRLGLAIAQARHELEGQMGLATLELPLGHVCRLEAFHWFVCFLLAQAPRVHSIYNRSLGEFRSANHIRNRAHPAPDLTAADEWIETPFWIYSAEDPRRRPLFARTTSRVAQLSDRRQFDGELPLGDDQQGAAAVAQLADWASRGVRIRPRALTATMFFRLFLSDLFIHGIGGAKYDQLTDRLIERLFDARSPGYLTVSATAHLPIERPAVERRELIEAEGRLRDMRFNPDRYLGEALGPAAVAGGELAPRIAEKQTWIAAAPDDEAAANRNALRRFATERHRHIEGANEVFRRAIAPLQLRQSLACDRLRQALAAEAILSDRAYSFCLFPMKSLSELLLAISSSSP